MRTASCSGSTIKNGRLSFQSVRPHLPRKRKRRAALRNKAKIKRGFPQDVRYQATSILLSRGWPGGYKANPMVHEAECARIMLNRLIEKKGKFCRLCAVRLTKLNWLESAKRRHDRTCKTCASMACNEGRVSKVARNRIWMREHMRRKAKQRKTAAKLRRPPKERRYMASIKNIEQFRNELLDSYDALKRGEIDARTAHARSATLSRVLYACNAEVRYHQAREEKPTISFMDYAGKGSTAPRTAKVAKKKR